MASHNNTRLFGTPVSGVTSRTVFRWTDGHNALFEAFVQTPEWTEVVPKTMVQLDSLVRDLGLTSFMGQTNAAGKVLGPIIQTKVLSKCYTVARALPAVGVRVPQVERAAEHTPPRRVVEVVDVNPPLGRRYPPVQYPELPLPADDHVEPNIHSIRRGAPARAPAPAVHQRHAQDVSASVAPAHRRPPEAADLQPHNRNHIAGARAPQARVPAQVDDPHVARGVPWPERPAPARAPAPPLPRLRPSQLVAANTPVPRHAPLLSQARPQAENPFLQPPGNRSAQRHRPVEAAVSFQPRQTTHIGVPARGRVPSRPPPYIEEDHPQSGPPVSPPPPVRPNRQRPPLAHHNRPPNNLAPPNPPHLPPHLDLRPRPINPVPPAMAPSPLRTTPPPPPRNGGAQHISPTEQPFPSSSAQEENGVQTVELQRGGSERTETCRCGRDAAAAAPGPTVLQPHMTVYYVEGGDERRLGGGRKKKEKKGKKSTDKNKGERKKGGKKGGKER